MQIITNNAGKELKKHGDNAFPFLVSYERLSGYETGSFLWHWHPEIELTYVKKGEVPSSINTRNPYSAVFPSLPYPWIFPVTGTRTLWKISGR